MNHRTSDKPRVRSRLLGLRAERGAAGWVEAGHALCRVALGVREIAGARIVCCYVPIGSEPDTRPLLAALRERGVPVLLPVLLPDGELDWGVYEGNQSLQSGPRGTSSPTGPTLGLDAIMSADAVLVPGVAVDRRGIRLGRGGGSYDRALGRINRMPATPRSVRSPNSPAEVATTPPAGSGTDGVVTAERDPRRRGTPRPFTAVVLYDGEILDELPHEPHDQHVDAAITPAGIVRFDRLGRASEVRG